MNMKRLAALSVLCAAAHAGDRVKTADGIVEGTVTAATGIRRFLGIPYAQPPVGELRWKAPRPVHATGVRHAVHFGPRCAQLPVFADMNFRSTGMGEDCLYLNIWTPATTGNAKLPVLVYFHGGGYVAGDGSEPRYDGASLAAKGIVTVTLNYRLGVFGFLSHPELTKESPHHASGNYGLLDQYAALLWVKRNIAAFGGDPNHITIAGESAGSYSVSSLMASPLSKDLIVGAIGESGSAIGRPVPQAEAEQIGLTFAAAVGATSLAELRSMTAEQLLHESGKPDAASFPEAIDGYFLPQPLRQIYHDGKQAHVPLLVGWNSQENPARMVLADAEPTPDNYANAIRKLYPDRAAEALRVYGAATPEEVMANATALAGDRFIAYGTWLWSEFCATTGGKPVYRYYYSHPRPAMRPEPGTAAAAGGAIRESGAGAGAVSPTEPGAVHSAEIEYALGNLATNAVYAWTADDYRVSRTMEDYFANFIKTGNPNGPMLPTWPAANGSPSIPVMTIDVASRAEPEKHRDRYEFLDSLSR